MRTIAIQGDLRIVKIDALPKGVKKRQNNVLVYGESTGHKHFLSKGSVYDYEDRILFTVPSRTTIIHEEHNPIPLEKGDYEIIRQREYKNKDAVSLVID